FRTKRLTHGVNDVQIPGSHSVLTRCCCPVHPPPGPVWAFVNPDGDAAAYPGRGAKVPRPLSSEQMEGIMPGMAEQDIALKLTGRAATMPRQIPVPGTSVPGTSGPATSAAGHHGLVARGLALCAVDALVTYTLGITIFAVAGPFFPISAPVLLVLFAIAALVSASLWERGLYSAPALL